MHPHTHTPLPPPTHTRAPLPAHTGIKKLDMHLPGEDRKQYLSMGISSPDGEYLSFIQPVVTEGRPEEWLNRVEDGMFATTKKHLYKVLEDSKGGATPPFTARRRAGQGRGQLVRGEQGRLGAGGGGAGQARGQLAEAGRGMWHGGFVA